MKLIIRSTALLLCLALLLPVYGWWDEGHMLVNRSAAAKLPKTMPLFFRTAAARIAYVGPEPDRWKAAGVDDLRTSEEPEHFLNMEMLDGMGPMPKTRYEYIKWLETKRAADAAAGKKPSKRSEELTPDVVGTQPYAVMEAYGRLVSAFRQYRKLTKEKKPSLQAQQDAIFYAGWMGHYVGDGAQPLHATTKYNGWVGDNPNGYTTDRHTHAKFEGEFVQANLKTFNVTPGLKPPTQLTNVWEDYLKYLQDSNRLVENVYQLEKAGAFNGKGSPEGVKFVNDRFVAAAEMLSDLWYTAWLESEKEPERRPRPATPPTPGEKKE